MQSILDNISHVDATLASKIRQEVFDKMSSPMLYNLAFPKEEANVEVQSDAEELVTEWRHPETHSLRIYGVSCPGPASCLRRRFGNCTKTPIPKTLQRWPKRVTPYEI